MDLIWTSEEKEKKMLELRQLKKSEGYEIKGGKLYLSNCNVSFEIIACAFKEDNRKITRMTQEVKDIFSGMWYNKNSVGFLCSGEDLYNVTVQKYIGISKKLCIEYVKNQEIWQLKTGTIEHKTLNPIVKSFPNELWCYDLIDFQKYYRFNNGNRWLMVVIDHFSKFGWVFPLLTKERKEIIPVLETLIKRETVPVSMLSDNEFRDKYIKRLYEEHKIIGKTSLPYTPQQNGCAERFVKTIKHKLMKYMIVSQRYINVLDNVVFNYNNQIHSTTGYRPVEVYRFGNTDLYEKVYENTKRKAERMKETIKKPQIKVKNTSFKIEDLVRINFHAVKTSGVKIKPTYIYTKEIYKIKEKKEMKSGEFKYLLDKSKPKSVNFWNEDERISEFKPVKVFSISNNNLPSLEMLNKYKVNLVVQKSINIEFDKKKLNKAIFVKNKSLRFPESKNIHIYVFKNILKNRIKANINDIFIIITLNPIQEENINHLEKTFYKYRNMHFYTWQELTDDYRWYYGYQLLKIDRLPNNEKIISKDINTNYFDINIYQPLLFNISNDFEKLKQEFWEDWGKKMSVNDQLKIIQMFQKYMEQEDVSITITFREFVESVEKEFNKKAKEKNKDKDDNIKQVRKSNRKSNSPEKYKDYIL